MFTFDRDTATIVAVLMCIVATVYMYRELNKTKTEMDNVRDFMETSWHIYPDHHKTPNL